MEKYLIVAVSILAIVCVIMCLNIALNEDEQLVSSNGAPLRAGKVGTETHIGPID